MAHLSRIGFGSYRVTAGTQENEEALVKALRSGINLIDTSTNYTDGKSEELIGKVLKKVSNEIPREDLTIISKYGYIQGSNMRRLNQGQEFPEIVPYSPACYHCIHPYYLQDQLKRSLERMQIKYIDAYLIHNPEYYLMHNIKKANDRDKELHLDEMQKRIGKAFDALEREVKNKTLCSYGISSNSFSVIEEDLHFLPYRGLIKLAQEAAEKAGNPEHSFKYVQLPANMIETVGLNAFVPWAASNGLKVIINRPLNAYFSNRLYRLATYKKVDNFKETFASIKAHFLSNGNREIPRILDHLENNMGKFQSYDHFEDSFNRDILPFVKIRSFSVAELDMINRALDMYKAQVCSMISDLTADSLKMLGISVKPPVQDQALSFLLNNKDITAVLLGMRKPAYVDTALKFK
ncbi:MAG: aldo/keto reductase [Firmicutes bacterium]|nr:aldo/keto reductase [Bacillota bacterium]